MEFSGILLVPAGNPMALVDAIGRVGSEFVVIAAHRSASAALRTGVSVAGGRWPSARLSCLVSDHAPLALLSALSLARAATEHPVIGVEVANWFLRNAWSGAWTSSVTRLAHPAPSMAQHVRSFLPGGGFLVRQSPDPQVLSTPRAADVPSLGFDRVLLVQDGAVPASVVQRLAGVAGAREVRQVVVPGDWRSVYGTSRAGQVALMPVETRPPISPPTHRCPVCGLEQVTQACPYCRVLARPAAWTVQA